MKSALLLFSLASPVYGQETDELKRDMKALELYLQDQKDYEEYCPKISWLQPEIEVYKEKLESQLPELKRIIREEKARLNELGIDRMTRADRDPRLDDIDDLTLGEETLEKIVYHLQALNDIVTSKAGYTVVGDKDEVEQIKALLPWAQDYLAYWRK